MRQFLDVLLIAAFRLRTRFCQFGDYHIIVGAGIGLRGGNFKSQLLKFQTAALKFKLFPLPSGVRIHGPRSFDTPLARCRPISFLLFRVV